MSDPLKGLKIMVLHWHGVCPRCGKLCCIYADFRYDERLEMKWPVGFECGTCGGQISDAEFDVMEKREMECPKEVLE